MWYVPMIRDYVEVVNGITVTNNGSVVVPHPRIIYPAPVIYVPSAAVAAIEVDDAEHTHEADAAEITAQPGTAEHAHKADSAAVTAAVNDAEHAHEAAQGAVSIAPEDSEHAHEATSALQKNIQDSEHAHEADSVAVTAGVDDSEHTHEADSPQDFIASPVDSAEHQNETDSAPVVITVHNAEHLLESDQPTIVVDVEDSTHLHEVDEVTIAGVVPVQSAEHRHFATMAEAVGFFRFATITARHDILAEYPVTFVEISKNPLQLDPSKPAEGKYAGVITTTPQVADEASESLFGIRTKSDVELRISMPGGPFKVDGGIDMRGWDAQVWRRRRGDNERLFRGKVSSMRLGHDAVVILRDAVRAALLEKIPNRFVTTAMFPNGAKDVGKPINIAVGENPRIPCPNVEWDDLNRVYRHALGEGVGYGGGNWGDVTRVYREDAALSQLTGQVASATASTLTLEAADEMPVGFLKYWFAEITSGQGAGQVRRVTQHLQEQTVTVSPNWTITPNTTSQYRLREWTWYDGSQASPYPGIAILEFGKPPVNGSRVLPVWADGDALQAEKNFVRFIQSVLSNTTWGKGIEVAEGAFDEAAALPEITALEAGGLLNEPRQVIEVLRELSMVRGLWLFS